LELKTSVTLEPNKICPYKQKFYINKLEHLNSEEREKLKSAIFQYKDIQYNEGENYAFTSTIKHLIQT